MNEETPSVKRWSFRQFLKASSILILIIISLPALLILIVLYANWAADRNAKAFCDSIQIGSDIVPIITRFDKETGYEKKPGGKVSARHYGYPDEGFPEYRHAFMFPGFMFDRAYCGVSLDKNGKVVSKNSYFEDD